MTGAAEPTGGAVGVATTVAETTVCAGGADGVVGAGPGVPLLTVPLTTSVAGEVGVPLRASVVETATVVVIAAPADVGEAAGASVADGEAVVTAAGVVVIDVDVAVALMTGEAARPGLPIAFWLGTVLLMTASAATGIARTIDGRGVDIVGVSGARVGAGGDGSGDGEPIRRATEILSTAVGRAGVTVRPKLSKGLGSRPFAVKSGVRAGAGVRVGAGVATATAID
jgi:hypothetical protein